MAKVTGSGSIVALEKPERTCQKWQLRVSLGRDYTTGRYITKTRRVTGSKTDAATELRAFINELESGIRTDTQNLTFAEFAETWQQERILSGEIELGTQRKDDYHIRSLKKHLGGVRLVDLNAEIIGNLYLTLRHGGSLSGEPMSGTSVHHIAMTLKHILEEAVRRDIILRNPCDKVKTPRVDTPEKKALSKEEARRLIGILMEGEPTAHTTGVLLALTCGLRREEILGLRWDDFESDEHCLKIRNALPADGNVLKTPKTKAGRRTLPLDEQTFARLVEWRMAQSRYLTQRGIKPSHETPIVTSKVGGFIHPQNFSRWWQNFRVEHDYDDISLHQLRHTFATLLISNGVDIVTSKTLMGHSDTKMLTELYAHCVSENVTRATTLIGGILHGEGQIVTVTPMINVV